MTQEPTDTKQPKSQDDGASIVRTGGLVAILTVLSKFAGLIRDIVVTAAYGTSVIADAYNYAYLFTGNILILFGGLGGPFHSSTVSIITPRKNDRESGVLVAQIMAITAIVLTVISVIAFFAAPYVVHAMNYQPNIPAAHSVGGHLVGNVPPSAEVLEANQRLFHQQVIQQLYIMLPLIVISGIVGVSYGVLNVYNKIFWPSLSPAIASIAIIVAIAVSDPLTRLTIGVPLAVGTLAGAVGQMLAQVPAMSKLDLNWQLTTKPQPGLKEYLKMLWPAVFSTSIGQLTVYVDSAFALMVKTQGAWTAIINSNRLVQLPLGILLTAMLVPILPRFTQQASEARHDDLKEDLRRALRVLWFLSLPMTAILMVIPKPLIDVLFQRGNFDESSTAIVSAALLWLAPSIVFYVARDLMTRVFYAYQDSMTPYKIAMLAIGVKALLDWLFVTIFQSVEGISLATTGITIFNLSLLTWALRKKIGNLGFHKLVKPLAIMATATVICGATTLILQNTITEWLHPSNTILKLVVIAASTGTGGLLYLLFCLAFKLDEPVMIASRLPVVRKFVRKPTPAAADSKKDSSE